MLIQFFETLLVTLTIGFTMAFGFVILYIIVDHCVGIHFRRFTWMYGVIRLSYWEKIQIHMIKPKNL